MVQPATGSARTLARRDAAEVHAPRHELPPTLGSFVRLEPDERDEEEEATRAEATAGAIVGLAFLILAILVTALALVKLLTSQQPHGWPDELAGQFDPILRNETGSAGRIMVGTERSQGIDRDSATGPRPTATLAHRERGAV